MPTRTPFLWTCKFPFVHFTISFMAGIVAAYYVKRPIWHIAQIGFFSLSTLYIVLVGWMYKGGHTFSGMGLLSLSSIFLAGYISLLNKQPEYNHYHLIHNREHVEAYQAVVIASPKVKKTMLQTTIALKQVRIKGRWQPICGKVNLQWPQDEQITLRYGDVLLVHGCPNKIVSWLNEDMFDYKSFLERQNTYHTHFVQHHDVQVLGYKPPSTIASWALQTQRWLAGKIEKNITDPICRGMVLALFLGMREVLAPDVQNMYIGAGVIHVLAVSGLHVGLLYMLILVLLWLIRLKKRLLGKVIALGVLWGYAWVTGLAPSVIRAVSMFSLFTINSLLRRRHNSINTLAISAFLLMLYNPLVIFHIGFQLSYTAVLGILWLQPSLYACLATSSIWIKKIWQFITISLAAQLATLPLILYYFHFFPTYFLLANGLIIPAAPVIIATALLIIITSPLPMVSAFLGKLITHLIHLLNTYIKLINHLPGSRITDAYPSLATTLSLYGILMSIWLFVNYRKFIYLLASTSLAMLIATHAIYAWVKPKKQWIFYSYPHTSGLAFVQDQKAILIIDEREHPTIYHSSILAHLQKIGVRQVAKQSIKPGLDTTSCRHRYRLKLVALQGKQGIWLDKPNTPAPKLVKPISLDFLLVENNAVDHVYPWLHSFKVGLLVIGTTNSPEVRQTLQQQAHANKVSCIALAHNPICHIMV